jgi:peroxiredoxin
LQDWRSTPGLAQIIALSTFRSPKFVSSNGLLISSGRFKGLCARATLLVDGSGKVLHARLASDLMASLALDELREVLQQHLIPQKV